MSDSGGTAPAAEMSLENAWSRLGQVEQAHNSAVGRIEGDLAENAPSLTVLGQRLNTAQGGVNSLHRRVTELERFANFLRPFFQTEPRRNSAATAQPLASRPAQSEAEGGETMFNRIASAIGTVTLICVGGFLVLTVLVGVVRWAWSPTAPTQVVVQSPPAGGGTPYAPPPAGGSPATVTLVPGTTAQLGADNYTVIAGKASARGGGCTMSDGRAGRLVDFQGVRSCAAPHR